MPWAGWYECDQGSLTLSILHVICGLTLILRKFLKGERKTCSGVYQASKQTHRHTHYCHHHHQQHQQQQGVTFVFLFFIFLSKLILNYASSSEHSTHWSFLVPWHSYLPQDFCTRCLENFFSSFIFISWSLITSQYCSGFCHTLTWTSHVFTCIPHPDPPSHLSLHPIPLGLPSAPGPRNITQILKRIHVNQF